MQIFWFMVILNGSLGHIHLSCMWLNCKNNTPNINQLLLITASRWIDADVNGYGTNRYQVRIKNRHENDQYPHVGHR